MAYNDNVIDFSTVGPKLTLDILTLAIEVSAIHQQMRSTPVSNVSVLLSLTGSLDQKLDEMLEKVLVARDTTNARRN